MTAYVLEMAIIHNALPLHSSGLSNRDLSPPSRPTGAPVCRRQDLAEFIDTYAVKVKTEISVTNACLTMYYSEELASLTPKFSMALILHGTFLSYVLSPNVKSKIAGSQF